MHTDSAAPPIARPDAPIDVDIQCPLCDYNLRGLTAPRCPECGFSFDWPDLLDPSHRKHPYLFEHHPERNIRSFFKTLLGSQRPFRFWQSVAATPTTNRHRIVKYWLMLVFLFIAVLLAAQIPPIVQNTVDQMRFGQQLLQSCSAAYARDPADPFYASAFAGAKKFASRSPVTIFLDQTLNRGALIVFGIPIAWPWLTLMMLLPWKRTSRPNPPSRNDYLRAAIYTSDIIVCLPCIFLGFASLGIWRHHPFGSPSAALAVGILALAVVVVIWVVRLYAACRTYLRLENPFAAANCTTLGSGMLAAGLIALVMLSAR